MLMYLKIQFCVWCHSSINTATAEVGFKFPDKKRYEGVMFNVTGVMTYESVGGCQISRKKTY